MPEKTTGGILHLRHGRRLGYSIYGDPNGRPGFYFHGFPGSRLEARIADAAAARLAICIVALDRPGFGLSDFQPRRAFADWPADVVEAADALGIDRFPLMGMSGGAPYAAACALNIPHRLTAAAIVSGFGPLGAQGATDGMSRQSRWFFAVARRLPAITRLAMWWMAGQARRHPDRLFDWMSAGLSKADKAILARPEVRQGLQDDIAEAFRSGGRGPAWELSLHARPWGFRLKDIAMEVHLWHGEADVTAPPSMGRHMARAIPNCRARFYPGEGHLMAVDRMEEIQAALFR